MEEEDETPFLARREIAAMALEEFSTFLTHIRLGTDTDKMTYIKSYLGGLLYNVGCRGAKIP